MASLVGIIKYICRLVVFNNVTYFNREIIMKFSLLFLIVFISSCASKTNQQPVKDSLAIKATTLQEKKVIVLQTLAKHPEFTQLKKEEIKKILITSLEKTEKLRERESQLLQQIIQYTIVKKGSYGQIVALKSELRTVYDSKFNNFDKAITKLKNIVGITAQNKEFVREISPFMF